jgi:hypothetical protein
MILIEHNAHKGFYQCSKTPDIYVSHQGEAYICSQDRFIRTHHQQSDSDTYFRFSVDGTEYAMHKLIADTFLKMPVDFKAIVNHKNGKKRDNRSDNLEWVNFSRNLIHAYETGLRTDITAMLSKDLSTGEVQEFPSMQQCARYFKVNPEKVFRYLKSSQKRIWLDNFVLVKKGQQWPDITLDQKDEYLNGRPKDVFVHDAEENRYMIFGSCSAASEYMQLGYSGMMRQLRSSESSDEVWVMNGKWQYCLLSKFQKDIPQGTIKIASKVNSAQFIKGAESVRKPDRIKTTDITTSDVAYYDSAQDLADKLGVSKGALQAYVYRHNGIWKNKLKVETVVNEN